MATPSQQVASYKEGRLVLALQAYQMDDSLSLSATAKSFDMPRNTLRRRLAGIQPQRGSAAANRLLSPTEEECLLQRILSMDRRGFPPRISTVHEMAAF